MQLTDEQLEFKQYLSRQLLDPATPLIFDALETKAYGLAALLFDHLTREDVAAVIQAVTIENKVEMARGDSIVDESTFTPWIEDRRLRTKTPRWDAYKSLLIDRNWEPNVIRALDEQTDDIVELMGDPESHAGPWPRRGLLMGAVQSGKTANYLGVLNKALDYGYRVIIVIAGHTEELRKQTQARFDTDLLGIDSERVADGIRNTAWERVGVGKRLPGSPNLMTTVHHDFSSYKTNSAVTWVDGRVPTVFITKKNPALLKNIRNYIHSQAAGKQLDIPLVVIDDESDWGSPNTREEYDPTAVNKAIRSLLDVSARSSYLAITATPFANIFIDDHAQYEFREPPSSQPSAGVQPSVSLLEDLFPSDYIRVMAAPNTYSGIRTYFLGNGHDAINTSVDDCLAIVPIKHKNYHPVLGLPPSLETATIQFLLGTAVRRLRDGTRKPASMLINMSRFKSVMREVCELERRFLERIVASVIAEFGRDDTLKSDAARRIEEVWTESFGAVEDFAWSDVRKKLLEIIEEFKVELVNGDTSVERRNRRKLLTPAQRLDDDLVPRIVIGGDILSRGLTLNGLQVSYFVREPRTMDTLMQMGRWFGFRSGYKDLIRIWMPETTQEDFARAAEVTEELTDTLLEMKRLGMTPRDFGLRVRVHPDSVAIVAANKAKGTQFLELGPTVWQNRLVESYLLTAHDEENRNNQIAVRDLILQLGVEEVTETCGGYLSWQGVPLSIIQDFFASFRTAPNSSEFGVSHGASAPIVDAFRFAPGNDRWSVVLVNGRGQRHEYAPGISVTTSIRNPMSRHRRDKYIYVSSRRVSSADNLKNSLLPEEEARLNEKHTASQGEPQPTSQVRALKTIDHPVLMIYTLTAPNPEEPKDVDFRSVEEGLQRVAVAIAFPKMSASQARDAAARTKKYQVNPVYWRSTHGYVDDLGDDVGEDETI